MLGLLGYVLFGAGYLVMLGIEFDAAYVLPSLADSAPAYVDDITPAAQPVPGPTSSQPDPVGAR
ncbi:hypothetical protein [Nonomuraea sp. LPB2021202275-12-8]|uniref:hypothetical protein n=1 Tax=Nonomuraea sp. LPB2021202275-12-8 TaxID=3120159 RepID=UPI00300C4E52